MKFKDYWAQVVAKYPAFKPGGKIVIKTDSLQALMEQAHQRGVIEGKKINDSGLDFLDQLLKK